MRPNPASVFAVLALALALPGTAAAQISTQSITEPAPRLLDVHQMSFSLWCQETQQWPTARCEQRRPADVKMFEDYRAAVERYEVQYLRQRQRDVEIQNRLSRDPSDTVRAIQDTPAQ